MSTEAAQLTWFTPAGGHKAWDPEKVEVGGLLRDSWQQGQDCNPDLLNPKFTFYSQPQSVHDRVIVILVLTLPLISFMTLVMLLILSGLRFPPL